MDEDDLNVFSNEKCYILLKYFHAMFVLEPFGKSRHFAGMQDDALMYRLNGLMKNEKVKKPEQI